MAIGDAYATVPEYGKAVDKTATDEDVNLQLLLTGVSRFIDGRVRRHDGFNKTAAAEARNYDIGMGGGSDNCVLSKDGQRILLPKDIATATELIVKCDLNGDYDYADANETLAVNTHFWIGPYNAANGTEPKPYEWLALIPGNSVVTAWPRQVRAVEITAFWGWPDVPIAIKELTIALTRYLRDIQESGMTFALNAIDTAVAESRQMSSFLRQIEQQYARPPSF